MLPVLLNNEIACIPVSEGIAIDKVSPVSSYSTMTFILPNDKEKYKYKVFDNEV